MRKKVEIVLQINSKLSILGENGRVLNGSRRKGVGEVKVSRNNNDFHFGQVQLLKDIWMELVQITLKLIFKLMELGSSLVCNWQLVQWE